ncbi:MAG: patatin-like phospholipase family protein [Chitinophagaceae bacterium]|nr:patatin-like phospholipase family protein [Chitinophagaceae bacterium]
MWTLKVQGEKYYLIIILIVISVALHAQQNNRPRIGLTLSGGGAKGLAHIGLLKAIDSAGLKIDYITGTSMGAILGSLYAVGYSSAAIEKIVRATDWDLLISNQSSLRSIYMEEKDEYSKYVLELPWQNNRLNLPIGLLTGQELWLKFSELFYPVYNQKNFSSFSIPFRCIGTDVGTGEAVVMKEGEIISAIRASMAIPSLFTAVDFNGRKLVDGGIVRNFPVRDVKEMGADIVIGSNVANALMPSEKVRNALQILLQVAFYREAEDTRIEVPLCDIYVPFELNKFSMGSFTDANSILEVGIQRGRELYPIFKKLAESLDAIYGRSDFKENRLPETPKVRIVSYEVQGVDKTSADFFLHTLDIKNNAYYSASKLADMVRQAYGTRYYSKVIYSLIPQTDSTCKILFEVTENPFNYVKLGLHYNKFSGVGVVGNITARNFLIRNSRSLVSINLGESFRVRGEHLQYIGRRKNFAVVLDTELDRFDVPTYDKYRQDGVYKQNYFRIGGRTQFSTRRQLSLGLGSRFEWLHYRPVINSNFEFRGRNNYVTTFFYLSHNSLDKAVYPRKGIRLDAEAGLVSGQKTSIRFLEDGQPSDNPDLPTVSEEPYRRTWLNVEGYTSLSKRTTLLMNLQTGVNFGYSNNVMNEFVVGGLTRMFRNQVLFSGLVEGTVYTPAVMALQGGVRYQMFPSTYITGRSNILFNNFISKSDLYKNPDFMSGYSLTFSYNFALGPLEISAMYSDQTRKVQSYINLGIPF